MAPLLTAEYEFARHNWQRDLLSIEYEPAAQYVQLVANAPENFPTAQPMHTSDPFLEVYLPATQPTHTPFVPDQPALHKQSSIASLLPAECESAAQSVHGTDPGLDLYLPATQPLQSTLVPVHPALHMQAVIAVLMAGEPEFAGQPRQPELPVSALYVPTAHPAHGPPFAPVHPALQMQAAVIVLALGEKVFAGQSTQPLEPKYVPERHWQFGTTAEELHQFALTCW